MTLCRFTTPFATMPIRSAIAGKRPTKLMSAQMDIHV
jgi:hypothetical protein